MIRWLRRWRERDDRHLIKGATPLPEIDPIEELARIVEEAQRRDAEDERHFERLARTGGSIGDRRRRNPRDQFG
jgi:hypothetical protein